MFADGFGVRELGRKDKPDANTLFMIASNTKLLTVPADTTESAKLAKRYHNDALGDIAVRPSAKATVFDFGEWKSEVASRKNPDGTISFITTAPGNMGFEFVMGTGTQRTLIIRDAQHEYVFAEGPESK